MSDTDNASGNHLNDIPQSENSTSEELESARRSAWRQEAMKRLSEQNTKYPSDFALAYLDAIKKSYQKMKESCAEFEQEHEGFCQRIGLDLFAFDFGVHPDHPAASVFKPGNLSERDQAELGQYLAKKEKMYLLKKCVHSIEDEDTRRIAEAYYLIRKSQPQISKEIGHSKSYVSKKLDKAENGIMPETIDRYFAWKYTVPGGKNCFWADVSEKRYMWNLDYQHGIIALPNVMEITKNLNKALHHLGL